MKTTVGPNDAPMHNSVIGIRYVIYIGLCLVGITCADRFLPTRSVGKVNRPIDSFANRVRIGVALIKRVGPINSLTALNIGSYIIYII